MNEPALFWDADRPALSRPITESDIRGWEGRHGDTLPRTLAAMLLIRNGGGVADAEFFIEPLEEISPIDDDRLGEASEGDELDLTDGGRLFAFGGDEVGAVLALDYSVGPEPRVVSLWFDGAGESRVEADSFDEFVGGGVEDPSDA